MTFAAYLLAFDGSLATSRVVIVVKPKFAKTLKIAINATAKFKTPRPCGPKYRATRIT
jgi:hypothetical protein